MGAQTNIVMNFDRRARYSVCTEYVAEFRSQSPIFGTQTNVELNFNLRDKYLVYTKFGA